MQISEQPVNGDVSHGSHRLVVTLLGDVDELLKYIAIVRTPEVDAIRMNLERSLITAKQVLLNAVPRPLNKTSGGIVWDSVGKNPWTAVLAAALLGAWFGKMVQTTAGARRHSVR